MILFKQTVNKEYLAKLERLLEKHKTDDELFEAIVNAPFQDKKVTTMLSLGIVVLLLVNKKKGTIDRIALSNTELAKGAVNLSVKPFKDIKIPVDYMGNYIVQAIHSGEHRLTSDWQYLFNPALTAEEARFNQAGAGIGCSAVYPLIGARDGGALIFSYYQPPLKIGINHHRFMSKYSKQVTEALSAQ